MNLLPDKKAFKEQRNASMIKDRKAGMNRKELSKKYNASYALIYSICRYVKIEQETIEPRELTEAEQRIRDRYREGNKPDAISKFHERNPAITNYVGSLEPFITIRPKYH